MTRVKSRIFINDVANTWHRQHQILYIPSRNDSLLCLVPQWLFVLFSEIKPNYNRDFLGFTSNSETSFGNYPLNRWVNNTCPLLLRLFPEKTDQKKIIRVLFCFSTWFYFLYFITVLKNVLVFWHDCMIVFVTDISLVNKY